jgi:hypothetical protein
VKILWVIALVLAATGCATPRPINCTGGFVPIWCNGGYQCVPPDTEARGCLPPR